MAERIDRVDDLVMGSLTHCVGCPSNCRIMREAVGGIDVVVDDEERGTAAAVPAFNGRQLACRLPDCSTGRGSRIDEPAAVRGSSALHEQLPGVQFDDVAREGQADAESAARALQRRVDLGEQFEDPFPLFRRKADAVIDDRDFDHVGSGHDYHVDRRTAIGILHRIADQIGDLPRARAGSAQRNVDDRALHVEHVFRAALARPARWPSR